MASIVSSTMRSLRRSHKIIGQTPRICSTTGKLHGEQKALRGSRRFSQWLTEENTNHTGRKNATIVPKRSAQRCVSTSREQKSTSTTAYGPLGRPIMTEESLKELLLGSTAENTNLSKLEDLVQLSQYDSSPAVFQSTSPKSLWNQSRDRFGFELPQYRHEILQDDDSSTKHQLQHKVTLLTVLANPSSSGELEVSTTNHCYEALRAHSHVGSHPDYDWIEMVTVGIAATKQHASQLAALDQIRLWKEATGVDLTLSPESWPLEAFSDTEGEAVTLSSHHQEKTDDALESLYSQSKTLLGLIRCSPVKYDFDFVQGSKRGSSYWTAEAETYWEGSYYFSTATDDQDMPLFLAKSKKEAKKHALVALLEQNNATSLGRVADSYKPLLKLSPKVAALRIPKWKEGIAKKLSASLDSWEASIDDASNDWSNRNIDGEVCKEKMLDEHMQPNMLDTISDTLWSKEQSKLQRYARDHPQILESIQKMREKLPIASLRDELKDALQASNIVLVQAGTGSGKSTQIPQFILEEALSTQMGATTRIIVTQPRRIAAKSLAERVAFERLESAPKGLKKKSNKKAKDRSVGYSVRFDSAKPRREGGSIEYLTTGILLKRLLSGDKGLEGISHVLIDEVHERDLDLDLLLVLMREFWIQGKNQIQLGLQPKIPKLVLLSATLDVSALTEYFAVAAVDGKKSIPVLRLPAKPLHPVTTLYLDDILENENTNGMKFPATLKELACSLLKSSDLLLKQELENLDKSQNDKSTKRSKILQKALSVRENQQQQILSENGKENEPLTQNEFRSSMIDIVAELALYLSSLEISDNNNKGSILCFLPGMSEIKECMHRIQDGCPKYLKGKLTLLPLHSDIPHREQGRVFKPPKAGTIKIILSTNIAESSLTIDDVLAVIDSGLVKESSFDATSGTTSLETIMTSKESTTQRLGRVGRVAPGICFRLYSKGDFEVMQDKTAPEIQKSCLSKTCLQIPSLLEGNNRHGFETVEEFLDNTIDAPSEESVQVALNELVSLGAISSTTNRLTALGECLVRLPLDPSIGKMLVMGAALNCLGPLLTAASWFGENQIVFSNASLTETRNSHRCFSKTSDTEGIIQAYDQFWQVQSNEGWKAARKWAREQRINPSAMTSMRAVRRQLLDELCRVGVVEQSDIEKGELRWEASINQNQDCKLLVSALWCTAFPKNLAASNKMDGFGVLTTFTDDSVRLHPSSVLFHRRPPANESDESSGILPEWYSFRRKVQTSNVFLRGCSSVLPEQILLFGGSHLDTKATAMSPLSAFCSEGIQNISGILDGWIVIEGSDERTVHLLTRARKAVQLILERKLLYLSSDSKKQLKDEKVDDIVESIRIFLDELENGRFPEPEPSAPSHDFLDYFLKDGEAKGH